MHYYCHRDGKTAGPFSLQQLREMLLRGALSPDDHVALVGATTWQMAKEVPGILPPPPPPPPPRAPHQPPSLPQAQPSPRNVWAPALSPEIAPPPSSTITSDDPFGQYVATVTIGLLAIVVPLAAAALLMPGTVPQTLGAIIVWALFMLIEPLASAARRNASAVKRIRIAQAITFAVLLCAFARQGYRPSSVDGAIGAFAYGLGALLATAGIGYVFGALIRWLMEASDKD